MAGDLGVSVQASMEAAERSVQSLIGAVEILSSSLYQITTHLKTVQASFTSATSAGASGTSAVSGGMRQATTATLNQVEAQAEIVKSLRLLERHAREAGDSVVQAGAKKLRVAVEQGELDRLDTRLDTIRSEAEDQGIKVDLKPDQMTVDQIREQLRGIQREYSRMGEVGKSRLTKKMLADLQGISSEGLKAKLRETAKALRSIGQEADAKKIEKFANSMRKTKDYVEKTNKTMTLFGNTMKFIITGILMKFLYKVAHFAQSTYRNAMNLVETFNLFRVALGENVDEAQAFVDEMSKVFGLNPTELYKSVGVFYQISTGLGLASKNAYTLSESLTKLSYDLASYYNATDIETAFVKLKAGIVGETEPLREWGIITTENALKAQLLKMGIDRTVESLSEVDKVMLRYITIMNATKNAQGDWARTLESPANQVRLLKSNIEQLSTTLGRIFLPMLNRAIPYVIAFVQVLGQAVLKIAELLGVDMKIQEFDVSGMGAATAGIMNDIEDAADSASAAVKEAKATLLGFDELNVLNSPTEGSGKYKPLNYGESIFGDLEGYDNLMSTVKKRSDELFNSMMEWIKEFSKSKAWEIIKAGFKLIGDAVTFLIDAFKWLVDHPTVAKTLGTIAGTLVVLAKLGELGNTFSMIAGGLKTMLSPLTKTVSAVKIKASESALPGILKSIAGKAATTLGPIAAVAAVFVGIGVALDSYAKHKRQKAIEQAFSDIEVSARDAEKALSPMVEAVEQTADSWEEAAPKLNEAKTAINGLSGEIDAYYQALTGSSMSEEDIEAFAAQAQGAISRVQGLLDDSTTESLSLFSALYKTDDGKIDASEQALLDQIVATKDGIAGKIAEIEQSIAATVATAINGTEAEREEAILKLGEDIARLEMLADPDFGKFESKMISLKKILDDNPILSKESYDEILSGISSSIDDGMTQVARIYESGVDRIGAQAALMKMNGETEAAISDFVNNSMVQLEQSVNMEKGNFFEQGLLLSNAARDGLVDSLGDASKTFMEKYKYYVLEQGMSAYDAVYQASQDAFDGQEEALAAQVDELDVQMLKIYDAMVAQGATFPEGVAAGMEEKRVLVNTEAGSLISGLVLEAQRTMTEEDIEKMGLSFSNRVGVGLNDGSKLLLIDVVANAAKVVSTTQDALGLNKPTYSSPMYSAGQALMDGVRDGMQSRVSGLKSKVISIADELNGAFKERNQVRSPSRLWAKDGAYIMEGLANGLKDGYSSVQSAMEGVPMKLSPVSIGGYGLGIGGSGKLSLSTGDLVAAIREGFKAAITESSKGSSEVQTPIVVSVDGREIVRAILPEMERESLRSGRRLL